ncbi:helix-turn-helix transcriptional regulator [Pedobacter nutrimenti]|uniref:helix-turn-helix domain-containing protein n=1 Tax=Pedobacter nutrimenti TaxID=1241337 RepID=UPI002931536E|nr:helix-turn-helix transcriptional regulator [Pedobacter nutrimenti]
MSIEKHIKTKLADIATNDDKWMAKAEWEKANKAWLDKSRKIAIKILRTLRSKDMTQSELAQKAGVSRQMISKIVKGNANLQLSTIAKLEEILQTDLMSSASIKKSAHQQIERAIEISYDQLDVYTVIKNWLAHEDNEQDEHPALLEKIRQKFSSQYNEGPLLGLIEHEDIPLAYKGYLEVNAFEPYFKTSVTPDFFKNSIKSSNANLFNKHLTSPDNQSISLGNDKESTLSLKA